MSFSLGVDFLTLILYCASMVRSGLSSSSYTFLLDIVAGGILCESILSVVSLHS